MPRIAISAHLRAILRAILNPEPQSVPPDPPLAPAPPEPPAPPPPPAVGAPTRPSEEWRFRYAPSSFARCRVPLSAATQIPAAACLRRILRHILRRLCCLNPPSPPCSLPLASEIDANPRAEDRLREQGVAEGLASAHQLRERIWSRHGYAPPPSPTLTAPSPPHRTPRTSTPSMATMTACSSTSSFTASASTTTRTTSSPPLRSLSERTKVALRSPRLSPPPLLLPPPLPPFSPFYLPTIHTSLSPPQ